MLSPIQVLPNSARDVLHLMSRINYGKTYTVEHNVKVFDFGSVAEDDIRTLTSQWRWVRDQTPTVHENEEEDEENDDDEESDEVDDDNNDD